MMCHAIFLKLTPENSFWYVSWRRTDLINEIYLSSKTNSRDDHIHVYLAIMVNYPILGTMVLDQFGAII